MSERFQIVPPRLLPKSGSYIPATFPVSLFGCEMYGRQPAAVWLDPCPCPQGNVRCSERRRHRPATGGHPEDGRTALHSQLSVIVSAYTWLSVFWKARRGWFSPEGSETPVRGWRLLLTSDRGLAATADLGPRLAATADLGPGWRLPLTSVRAGGYRWPRSGLAATTGLGRGLAATTDLGPGAGGYHWPRSGGWRLPLTSDRGWWLPLTSDRGWWLPLTSDRGLAATTDLGRGLAATTDLGPGAGGYHWPRTGGWRLPLTSVRGWRLPLTSDRGLTATTDLGPGADGYHWPRTGGWRLPLTSDRGLGRLVAEGGETTSGAGLRRRRTVRGTYRRRSAVESVPVGSSDG